MLLGRYPPGTLSRGWNRGFSVWIAVVKVDLSASQLSQLTCDELLGTNLVAWRAADLPSRLDLRGCDTRYRSLGSSGPSVGVG